MIVPEQVITGEGVVVDIAPAPLPTRMGSAVIDYAVYFLGLSFSLRLLYTAVNQSTVSAAVLATCVALMLAFWLICGLCATTAVRLTLIKALYGLSVLPLKCCSPPG